MPTDPSITTTPKLDGCVPLSGLGPRSTATVACLRGVGADDSAALRAMGLNEQAAVRVCQCSGCCVLEVGIRGTSRLAVSKEIASRILVRPTISAR